MLFGVWHLCGPVTTLVLRILGLKWPSSFSGTEGWAGCRAVVDQHQTPVCSVETGLTPSIPMHQDSLIKLHIDRHSHFASLAEGTCMNLQPGRTAESPTALSPLPPFTSPWRGLGASPTGPSRAPGSCGPGRRRQESPRRVSAPFLQSSCRTAFSRSR